MSSAPNYWFLKVMLIDYWYLYSISSCFIKYCKVICKSKKKKKSHLYSRLATHKGNVTLTVPIWNYLYFETIDEQPEKTHKIRASISYDA